MIHDVKKQHDKLHKTIYYQFDWTCDGITILRLKWYPKGKGEGGYSLFYPQSYNAFMRKWQDHMRLSKDRRTQLEAECQELWGNPQTVAPKVAVRVEPIVIAPPPISNEVMKRIQLLTNKIIDLNQQLIGNRIKMSDYSTARKQCELEIKQLKG